MPEEAFRLPGSSYEEISKIIKAYGLCTNPASPGDVTKLCGIHPTIVSKNNAFLVAIGIAVGGKKKQITPLGLDLSRALEHEIPEEIERCWRGIVEANEFLQKVVSAVKVRKGMERSNLQAHVAYSAGLPKKGDVMTGANTVIDILLEAHLLKEEDGKLIAILDTGPTQTGPESSAIQPEMPATDFSALAPRGATWGNRLANPVPQVIIQVQIQCSANEIEGLTSKLRKLLAELANPIDPAI